MDIDYMIRKGCVYLMLGVICWILYWVCRGWRETGMKLNGLEKQDCDEAIPENRMTSTRVVREVQESDSTWSEKPKKKPARTLVADVSSRKVTVNSSPLLLPRDRRYPRGIDLN